MPLCQALTLSFIYLWFSNFTPLRSFLKNPLHSKSMHLFTELLYQWHQRHNHRDLPWKGESDPYKIWLSEIILQQTRTEQGRPYYLRFVERYPTVAVLAAAPDEDVFKLWQGLGYYSRCKNMLAAARKIVQVHQGIFPSEYAHIRSLPGVGDYTAAAIGSFAFGLPHAVVDGNVIRVLSRFFRIDEDAYASKGRKKYAHLAASLLHLEDPAAHNQAIMDLGAVVCTPRNPRCHECPLRDHCMSYRDGVVALYPPPKARPQVQERHLNYIIIRAAAGIYMQQRSEGGIWVQLFEPYLIETPGRQNLSSEEISKKFAGLHVEFLGSYKQRLTHRLVYTHWFTLRIQDEKEILGIERLSGRFFSESEIKKLALPKSISAVMSKKNYF